ncbi:ester cyclase [Paeniglutamicibacter sp. R2-26]|uniref:ester cyclase n=1 Tax=Paeniglutamicibacter sp. R2-26 TaxID=3144417 RepID=UPI003EE4E5C1
MSDGTGLIKRFYEEVLAGGNTDLIDELVAEGFVDHESLPGQPPGKDGVRFFVEMMRSALPDLNVQSFEPSLAEGNLEAVHTVLAGTHRGELMGVAATGQSIEFESIDIIRTEGGKVVEHWGITDTTSLMQQIGASPE